MPILQWMCYRKLRSACMRLTIRSPFRAVLQYVPHNSYPELALI